MGDQISSQCVPTMQPKMNNIQYHQRRKLTLLKTKLLEDEQIQTIIEATLTNKEDSLYTAEHLP